MNLTLHSLRQADRTEQTPKSSKAHKKQTRLTNGRGEGGYDYAAFGKKSVASNSSGTPKSSGFLRQKSPDLSKRLSSDTQSTKTEVRTRATLFKRADALHINEPPAIKKASLYDELCKPHNINKLRHYVKSGRKLNVSCEGKTLLMAACEAGNAEAVKFLINNGAKVNVVPKNLEPRSNALTRALEKRDKNIICMLLEKQASERSLSSALKERHMQIAQQTGDPALINLIRLSNTKFKVPVTSNLDVTDLLPLLNEDITGPYTLVCTRLSNDTSFLHLVPEHEISNHDPDTAQAARRIMQDAFNRTLASINRIDADIFTHSPLDKIIKKIQSTLAQPVTLPADLHGKNQFDKLENLLLNFSRHVNHHLAKNVGNAAAVSATDRPTDTPLAPTGGLIAILSTIRKELDKVSPEAGRYAQLKSLENETMTFWMQGKRNHEATLQLLGRIKSKAYNKVIRAECSKLIDRLAQPAATSPALLHDNLYGRAFDSLLAARLFESASDDLLDLCSKYVDFMMEKVNEVQDGDVKKVAEDLYRSVLKANRAWYNESLRDLLVKQPDFSRMTPQEARSLIKSLIDQPGKAKIFSAFTISARLMSAFNKSKFYPSWSKRMQDNYKKIETHRKRSELQPEKKAQQYRENLITGGVTMQHQPAPLLYPLGGVARPLLVVGPDLVDPTPAHGVALREGQPLAVDLSGSMNVVGHFVGMMREKNMIDVEDIDNMLLGAAMAMVIEGGHSFHEVLWTANQIAHERPSFEFPVRHPDADNFVTNYQELLMHSAKSTASSMEDVIEKTFPDLLRYHDAIQSGRPPLQHTISFD